MTPAPCDALLATAPNTIEHAQVQPGPAGPNDVVIRTRYTSVSAGTERQLLGGAIATPGGPPFPYIPGYEATGEVVAVGAEAPRELLGQLVYVGGSMQYSGTRAFFGAQSATIVSAAGRVIPLGGLDPRTGLLIGLAATALHGLHRLSELAGASILICGQGAVGRLTALAARHLGAAWIAVTDTSQERLAAASGDELLLVVQDAASVEISERPSAIVEASGRPEALLPFISRLRPNGTILLLGFYERFTIPYMPFFFAEPTLVVSREWAPGDPERARDLLLANQEQAVSLLTHDFPTAQADQAFAAALTWPACLKVAIAWP